MHIPHGLSGPRTRPENDELPSLQEIYATLMSRATEAMRGVAIFGAVVFALWGLGFIAFAVVGFLLLKKYMRHHRIEGTLLAYGEHGDWALIELGDGTRVTAHCPLVGLPEGTQVVVSVRRGGVYVTSPGIGDEEAALLMLEPSDVE